MNQTTKEYRQKIAESFVKSLEEEQLDWKKNWKGMSHLPENAITGKRYKGINSFWLSFRNMQTGSDDPRWATFKQIQDAGWKLNKGSKGEKIEYWQPYDFEKRAKLSWDDYRIRAVEEQVGLIAKYYTVFNAKDITGIPERTSYHNPDVNTDELVTRLSRNMDVEIINDGGDRAYYRPSEDKIHLPEPKSF